MKSLVRTAGLVLLAVVLASCERETPLPGERIDIRDVLDDGGAVEGIEGQTVSSVPLGSRAFAAPPAVNHSAWTHRGGSAVHRISHPALRAGPVLVWSADIGAGDSRRAKITADPVVAGGRVFTLDALSRVMAHSTGGAPLWARDLVPVSDNRTDASGGGLAIEGNRLFVTTGFGELYALDAATGQMLWRQGFDAPVSGAPTVRSGTVYVSSRDSRGLAVRADNGRVIWDLPATSTRTSTVNGAGPAVTDRLAIFPFGSAELMAVLRQSGLRAWTTNIAGQRLGRAYAGVTDIAADPVVVGNTLYAGSPSGRIAAIDVNSGERLWTAPDGALSPVWVDGGSVFAVNDIQQLVRLDAATGEAIWRVALPEYKAERKRRIRDVYAHYGPVLAGGRLIVASDDGGLRSFDPRNGALLSGVQIPGGASSNPVVVNGTLYLVSGDGNLLAFR